MFVCWFLGCAVAQTTKHTLAELKTEIAVGRAFVDQCLELHAVCCGVALLALCCLTWGWECFGFLQIEKLDSPMASMAKYWATDLQNKAADIGVQLHGGAGYMQEYPISRHYVDARVQRM